DPGMGPFPAGMAHPLALVRGGAPAAGRDPGRVLADLPRGALSVGHPRRLGRGQCVGRSLVLRAVPGPRAALAGGAWSIADAETPAAPRQYCWNIVSPVPRVAAALPRAGMQVLAGPAAPGAGFGGRS